MTCTLHVAWDDRLAGYDFGPGHPMAPVRLKLTIELARAFGLFRLDGVSVEVPAAATRAELELYHAPAYIDVVRLAGSGRLLGAGQQDMTERVLLMHGLGTEDDPVFPGMHEAAAMVTGATLAAARAVWTSAAQHGASIAGGLHHAMAGNASGFCVYNDPAIAIAWLLGQGAERIAYVDVDAHHGDGVEGAFWNDPRVLTIGLHEHPESLFPGTGYATDTGGPHAEGSAVNVALPALTGDAGWLRAFHAVVPPLLREFRPQVLVSQHGCDSHRDDPLTNLELTIDAQRAAHAAIHRLAHESRGRPLAAHRGRRLRARARGAAKLDPPAVRGGGPAARPGRRDPGAVARVRVRGDQPGRPGNDDRRRPGHVRRLRRTATTRPTPSTRPSWPPGRPSSPCTASCPEPGPAPSGPRRGHKTMPRCARTTSTRHPLGWQGQIASAAVLRRDDEDRAVRVMGDLAGHRPHHQPGEPARAPRAQDQHVGVLARVDELLDREAVDRLDRDRVRAGSRQPGQHLVGLGLGRLRASSVRSGSSGYMAMWP